MRSGFGRGRGGLRQFDNLKKGLGPFLDYRIQIAKFKEQSSKSKEQRAKSKVQRAKLDSPSAMILEMIKKSDLEFRVILVL
jgi:hypothetical protein